MTEIKRKKTKKIKVGNIFIGGDAPIVVQSMCNTDTRKIGDTVNQILKLQNTGCELVRVAVPDLEAAKNLSKIKKEISIPIVADIHFDYKLALVAMEAGVDKLRINPGNIGSENKIEIVVKEATLKNIPIRIGVNAGSLEKDILRKYTHPTPEALVESALRHVRILERHGFHNIIISLKSSDIPITVRAYKLISDIVDYPLHLGITEAGTAWTGTIASAIGIGSLLNEGIGDTLRVSLTAPPEDEVTVGFEILKVLGIRQIGPRFISCPSCGRTSVDLISIAQDVQMNLSNLKAPIKIAIMGCEVNGPGEAAEADIGLACGRKSSLIFIKGKVIKKISNNTLVNTFTEEVMKLTRNRENIE